MDIALQTSGLATQPRPGVGLRLVRRIGGAVRSVFARGITRAGGQRHNAAPPQDAAPAPAATPAAPPVPPRATRRRRMPSAAGQRRARRFLASLDPVTPFTPEAFPGLSPEACALFNTPLEECDPVILEQMLAWLAQHIAANMPADSVLGDADAVFANLWGRLGAALRQPVQDPAPGVGAETPAELAASPEPLPPVAASAPAEAAAGPRPAAALPFPDLQPIHLPLRRLLLASASALPPAHAVLTAPLRRDSRTLLRCRTWFRPRGRLTLRAIRRVIHGRRALVPAHVLRDPQAWRWCYASRASPA